MTLSKRAVALHKEYKGKLSMEVKMPLNNLEDLSLAYSPGVAEPCKEIQNNRDLVYDYTIKGNLVAVVSDGSAVLGLGNIGAEASLPVMEGKAALFKRFSGIDAVPLCLNTQDPEEIINIVKSIEPSFGGINLEDIAAPNCFIIEERLKKEMNIPVFHDDQHGTAIVTAAALINSLLIVNKRIEDIRVVINGAGAAGIAVVKLLASMGVKHMIICDSKGAIYTGREEGMNSTKDDIALITNKQKQSGLLAEIMKNTDVFIGVSAANVVTKDMVATMNEDAIIFAMANPVPEVSYEDALSGGARIFGTGRSDLPNQINNILAFPGIFRGALNVRASEINEEMKKAAVYAIAKIIKPEELHEEYVVPSSFDERVVEHVSDAVGKAAIISGAVKEAITKEVYLNI